MKDGIKKILTGACAFCLVGSMGTLFGCANNQNNSSGNQQSENKGNNVDNTGKKVKVNYKGTLDDGSQFDSSYDRGQPLEFTVGAGQMIKGFDAAVKDMTVGEKKTVRLSPDEAYGQRNESLVHTYKKSDIPNGASLKVGDQVYMSSASGQQVPAYVTAIDGENITIDANNKMAGKYLTFLIELMEVES